MNKKLLTQEEQFNQRASFIDNLVEGFQEIYAERDEEAPESIYQLENVLDSMSDFDIACLIHACSMFYRRINGIDSYVVGADTFDIESAALSHLFVNEDRSDLMSALFKRKTERTTTND